MNKKLAKESLTIMTNLVLPNETNTLGNMFGGDLLAKMDRIGAIAAQKHSEKEVVTVAVNHVSFHQAIPLGSVITLEAKVSRAFNSSMEVFIDVWLEDIRYRNRKKVNEGVYTFVTVDKSLVAELIPETSEEKKRYKEALARKQMSLTLDKKG